MTTYKFKVEELIDINQLPKIDCDKLYQQVLNHKHYEFTMPIKETMKHVGKTLSIDMGPGEQGSFRIFVYIDFKEVNGDCVDNGVAISSYDYDAIFELPETLLEIEVLPDILTNCK